MEWLSLWPNHFIFLSYLQIVSKVAATLRSASVTDAEVKTAKNALTIEWSEMMNSNLQGEILAYSATHGFSEYMTDKAVLNALSQCTVGDVQVRYIHKNVYLLA